jgi:hypothetical protein
MKNAEEVGDDGHVRNGIPSFSGTTFVSSQLLPLLTRRGKGDGLSVLALIGKYTCTIVQRERLEVSDAPDPTPATQLRKIDAEVVNPNAPAEGGRSQQVFASACLQLRTRADFGACKSQASVIEASAKSSPLPDTAQVTATPAETILTLVHVTGNTDQDVQAAVNSLERIVKGERIHQVLAAMEKLWNQRKQANGESTGGGRSRSAGGKQTGRSRREKGEGTSGNSKEAQTQPDP